MTLAEVFSLIHYSTLNFLKMTQQLDREADEQGTYILEPLLLCLTP
jgi:hypothetical protein